MSISTLIHPFALAVTTVPTSQPVLSPATPPPVPPLPPNTTAALILIAAVMLFMAMAVVIFIAFRVYQPRMVVGPRRLPPRGKAAILLISFGAGVFAWFVPQVVFASHKAAELERQGVKDARLHLEDSLAPKDLAILSTVPQVLAFLVMVAIVSLAGDSLASRLGLSLRKLPRGVGAGILAFIVIFPLVILGNLVIEPLYRHFGFQHPAEHELLKSFGQAQQSGVAIIIVIGATICAPLFEEFLFRGHLQTLLRHMFLKWSKPQPEPAEGAPMNMPPTIAVAQATWFLPPPLIAPLPRVMPMPPALPYMPAQVPVEVLPLETMKAWPSWLAIILTALLFSLVHPLWMAPLIFVLSIGLGYVYERTGILWASITVHMLFNATNTFIYYITTIHGH